MGTTVVGTPVTLGANVNPRSLAWLALRLAEINAPDIRQSTATGGTTTTLVDTVGLIQPNDHWLGGTLWILSGGYAGTVKKITDSALSGNSITFSALTSAISAGIDYVVLGPDVTYANLVMAINQALREITVEHVDKTLVGVNGTYEYTLPTDVTRVVGVDLYRSDTLYKSTHWSETEEGKIKFDRGYSPCDDDAIWLHYLETHGDLETDAEEVEDLLELPVLMQLATEKLMRLLYHRYGGDQKQIPEWLADAMAANKERLKVTRRSYGVLVHTSGW